jgi:predicted DsbA family dithiol-disulfide isomerase
MDAMNRPGEQSCTVMIYSDIVCPWCYVGKRRLEKALAMRRGQAEVSVLWRPFELNPTMPPLGMDRRVYLEAKFGGSAALEAMQSRLVTVGAEEGIVFAFDRMQRTPNTFDAHRLVYFAQREGRQDATVERLFQQYFTEGVDIGDRRVLMDLAGRAGLDAEAVGRFLASDDGVAAVRDEEAEGHRRGIRGVPYFIFNHTVSLSGAHPPDVILSAIEEAGEQARENAEHP